jgi:hypothetical protein
MSTSVPTEREIQATAEHLGLVDETGRYRQRDRARIAAAIQRSGGDPFDLDGTPPAEPSEPTTAQQLARFADELAEGGSFTPESTTALLTEAARFLLRTVGLQLNSDQGETTP